MRIPKRTSPVACAKSTARWLQDPNGILKVWMRKSLGEE